MSTQNRTDAECIEEIQARSIALTDTSDLDALIEAIGDSKYVLLGEASHGTSEFYRIRAALTRRLIEEKGFSFVAVEGDWPDCYRINEFVKGAPRGGNGSDGSEAEGHSAPSASLAIDDVMQEFGRWPTWMWANEEVREFALWLRDYNHRDRPEEVRTRTQKVGFYGIDMYSLWESMDEIVRYLTEIDAPELEDAKKAFSCFDPHGRDPQTYGLSATYMSEHCEEEVVQTLLRLRERRMTHPTHDEEELSMELNAMVAVDAEKYYRAMFHFGPESWNIRDTHMVQALEKLMEFHGDGARCVVWEHNTHIGDARFTDMADEGMVNVGQLLRESHPKEQVYAVGFGTYQGSVIAGRSWGARIESMQVPPAQSGSWEDLLHRAGAEDKYIVFETRSGCQTAMPGQGQAISADAGSPPVSLGRKHGSAGIPQGASGFQQGSAGIQQGSSGIPHAFQSDVESPLFSWLDHRAIGVVYDPLDERGNYVPTIIPKRYDAFIYIDESHALTPIRVAKVLV